MKQVTKTPFDILDDIYSLAFWMTGNENDSQDLVMQTYLLAGRKRKESSLLRIFRQCYIDRFGQVTPCFLDESSLSVSHSPLEKLKQWAADIKLSVLLSEISGLGHTDIASVVGKPVGTVREWLYTGRKLFDSDCILKASA
jgi:DNA-directed RNA polymerase specialized sigma24 family protein